MDQSSGLNDPFLTQSAAESRRCSTKLPGRYNTTFPRLLVVPPAPWCLALIAISCGTLYARDHWREELERRGWTTEELLKYLSIPLVSVLFTYFHIWVALYMTFYPIKFTGCLQIPGTNVGCGWQGIVPSKGEKMARTAVKLMTTKLLGVQEVFARIDPVMVARELDPVLHSTLTSIIHEVGMQEEPQIWESLPGVVKNELIQKAREEAPPVIKDMMRDVQDNIVEVFDLEDMVVKALVRDPGLMNHMFVSCGFDELLFIRNCGAYMGGIFGIIQVILWAWYSEGWMLPAFGFVVGLFSNWIALKMIFEPVEPVKLLGGLIVVQGLFLKRQAEVSQEYGRIVAGHVLSSKHLIPAVISGKCSTALFELVHRHVQASCDQFVGAARPVVRLLSGAQKYDKCKRIVGERLIASLTDSMMHVERYMDSAMDLENLLTTRLKRLPAKDFEQLLHPVFQEDEWMLVLMGGALGVAVGFMQWYALGS